MPDGAAPRWEHDFFISYAEADRGWAEWVTWQLESAERRPGQPFRVSLPAWDFVPGVDRVRKMEDAIARSERLLVVWSSQYARSPFGQAELRLVWGSDPGAERRRILPVRVEEYPVDGLLRNTVHVDLFGMAKEQATDTLLQAVKATTTGRRRPDDEPPFPASQRGAPTGSSGPVPELPRDAGDPGDPATWPGYRDIAARIAGPRERDTLLDSAAGNASVRRCLLRTCRYLFEAGQYADSRRLAHEMRERLRRILGPDHEDTLTAGQQLARAMAGHGEFQAALELTDDLLARRRAVLGPHHRDTLTTAANRGVLLTVRGRFDEARSQIEETLHDRRMFLDGDNDPDVLTSISNLGTYWRARTCYDDALGYHTQARDGFAGSLDDGHLLALASTADVALDFLLLGRTREARLLLATAYEGRVAKIGENHPATLDSAQRLVAAMDALGEYDDALRLGEATLARYCRVLGEDDPQTRTFKRNMERIRERKQNRGN
jgi:tetratricopeptide (TPR) repeat protein